MAGERKGHACEAIVHCALERLVKSKPFRGDLEWNTAIPGLSVEPDLWIRDSKGVPLFLLLVTHSGAPSASEKKFWRNVGEIAEAKLLLANPPTVGSILFDTSVKQSLRLLEPLVGDFYIEVPDLLHGHDLIALAETLSETSRSPEESLTFVKDEIKRNKKIEKGIEELVTAIEVRVAHHTASPQETIWIASSLRLSNRSAIRLPDAKDTSIRRGLAKLLVPEDANAIVDSVGRVLRDAPVYLSSLGITGPSIRGTIVRDQEIIQAVQLLGKPAVKRLIASTRTDPAYEALVKPLRVMAATAMPMASYVQKHWRDLQTSGGLFRHLKHTHANGAKAVGLPNNVYVRPGWLFILLSSMLKARSGKRQAFGYAKIIQQLAKMSPADRSALQDLAKDLNIVGTHSLRSPRTIEYGLRDWFFGDDRANFDLRDVELLASACIVSEHISSIDGSTLPALITKAQAMESQDLFENIIIPFNKFQPLKLLLKQEMLSRGLKCEEISYYPSPVFQKLAAAGHAINVRASSTSVLQVKSTLVRWISVSDEGKDHKRKEFGGRAAMLPIEWSVESHGYKVRSNVKRLLLLVDGTFTKEDLSLLTKVGWDGIYYPDEVDHLCSDVV